MDVNAFVAVGEFTVKVIDIQYIEEKPDMLLVHLESGQTLNVSLKGRDGEGVAAEEHARLRSLLPILGEPLAGGKRKKSVA